VVQGRGTCAEKFVQIQSVRFPRDVIPVSALLYAGACRRLIESRCRPKNRVDVGKNWEAGKRGKPTVCFLVEVVSCLRQAASAFGSRMPLLRYRIRVEEV
jgi:hypothetical protein